MKRRLRKEVKWFLAGIALSQVLNVGLHAYNSRLQQELDYLELKVSDYKVINQIALESPKNAEYSDIIVTNYYLGDGSSGTTTASGYAIKDFEVNEECMYTFNDMIVIATANTTRLDWDLKSGFNSHELFEILTLKFNDKEYTGIVLDICGACYGINDEELQRYDVFTTGEVIGKVKGVIE